MKLIFTQNIISIDELRYVVELMKKTLPQGAIVALSGNLGAGKTTLVAEFCKIFGLTMSQSPTYAIHQQYKNAVVCIDHFDLYRLETDEEIEASGFYDLLSVKSNYKFIEWAERVPAEYLQTFGHLFKIEIKLDNKNQARQISLFQLN